MNDEISNIDNKTGKYIYKITNTVNGKCYIGQAKDYKARFQGHKLKLRKNEHDNPHLQYAWNNYGADAFTFEVLEFTEDYNEREKYYIKLYNSTDELYGYNILEGGESPPVRAHSTLSLDDVKRIQNMFLDGYTLDDICKDFPLVTRGQINKIKNGTVWKDDTLTYPLKKDNDNEIGTDIANLVIYDLLNTSLTQKEIAKKYNIARTCVTAINNGNVQKYYNEEYTYPLREHKGGQYICKNKELIQNIINELRYTRNTYENIALKFDVSSAVVADINHGKRPYNYGNTSYPIRNDPIDRSKYKATWGRNTSGVLGVTKRTNKDKWRATIIIDKKTIYLGEFQDKNDAIKARLNFELEYFGSLFAPQLHLFEQYGIKVNSMS